MNKSKIMHVVCIVLVIVYAGQTCHGSLVHQGPLYTLDRARRGSAQAEEAGLREYLGNRDNDIYNMKKLLRTSYNNKDTKHKDLSGVDSAVHPFGSVLHNPGTSSPVQSISHIPDELRAFMAAIKPANIPRRLQELTTRGGWDENRARWYPWRHVGIPFHFPINMAGTRPCKTPRDVIESAATAPPNVCDLCPTENGKNPLDPCTCVGVGGSSAGTISIHCPPSVVSLDQLRDIFHNTNFLTTHVFQFSLQGSMADGALTRDIWGDLDFEYISIKNNRITDVDNGAFIGSNDSLIALDLANNQIKSYIAMYNNLPNLLYLSLQGNNISLIYSEDFNYPVLTELDLSHNEITSIGWHSFAALKKLKKLNLSNNLLSSIDDERFTFIDHDYTNVLEIDLSNNKIAHIKENAFLGLRSAVIDFRSNRLHAIEESIFSPIILDSQYYAYFYFSGNEMICDCGLLWVVEDGKILFSFDNFECSNIQKSLYSLEVGDLGNCSSIEEYP